MSNTIKLGKELIVVYSGQSIARATSYSFTINKTEIDIGSLDSDGWAEKLADQKEWSIDFDGLVSRGTLTGTSYSAMSSTTLLDFDGLLQQLKTNDEAVTVALSSKISNDKYETGSALITSLSMTGSVGSAVSYSGTLSGTGALTQCTA